MGKPVIALKALTPCEGLLPVSIGTVTLSETDMAPLTLIAPMKGKEAALAKTLKAAHGLDWPEAGATTLNESSRLIWFGRAQALLVGGAPSAKLSAHAAVTDQSDAWARVLLEGCDAREVLARLTPLDMRDTAFPGGATARTEVFHMQASLTRMGEDSFQLLGFRSMAATLVHDLTRAMESMAARRA